MILRGAGGLGDAVYMYPVLRHFLEQGKTVEILTKYPEIYEKLQPFKLIISDRYSKQPEVECRYAPRYSIQTTTTYQDTLIFAGIEDWIPLEIEFNEERVPQFQRPKNKQVCVVRVPALPMKGREDAAILIPEGRVMQKLIDEQRTAGFFIVAVGSKNGHGKKMQGIDLDLTDALNIRQLLTIIQAADCAITQPSFILPFAEVLLKPCFVLFSAMSTKFPRKFYHHITPQKIINRHDLVSWAIDEEGADMAIDRLATWRRRTC